MKSTRIKSIFTGLAAAVMLAGATFANTAMADHNRGKHSGWGVSIQYGNQHRHQGNRHFGHVNRGNRHHLGHRKPRYSSHNHRRHHRYHKPYRHYGHNYRYRHGHNYRGHLHYRSNDLVGALVGGAIVYHFGRKLIRH